MMMHDVKKDYGTIDDLYCYLEKNTGWITQEFMQSLTDFARSIVPSSDFKTPNTYEVTIVFRELTIGGYAEYSSIILHSRLLDDIVQDIKIELESYLVHHQCIKENYIDFNKWQTIAVNHPFYLPLHYFNKLISTFIHELIHIKQHSKQDNPLDGINQYACCKNLEYRSYLMDKRSFILCIKNLKKGIRTNNELIAHISSPQEIPARAHSSVLKYISTIVNVNPLTLQSTKKDINLLNQYIAMMIPSTFDTKYQIFNSVTLITDFSKPNSKEYKIYKRYMKIVYQEIMMYKQYLINIRDNL